MFKSAAITTGIIAILVVPSMTTLAAEENKSYSQSGALRLMQQTREYVSQENRYQNYAATEPGDQLSQDKTRTMSGADNETGQGKLERERIRHRDGTDTGSQNKYDHFSSRGQYGAGGGSTANYGGSRGTGGGGRR